MNIYLPKLNGDMTKYTILNDKHIDASYGSSKAFWSKLKLPHVKQSIKKYV